MDDKNRKLLTIMLVILVALSGVVALFILAAENRKSLLATIRVACVGDSITRFTDYPLDLMLLLGREHFLVGNFGAGSTTVSLSSETPYMNNSRFQSALQFQPKIVVIMLGTNDAQPSLFHYNATFAEDYSKLIKTFQASPSKPKIWVVLPPPIFSNQSGRISPEYYVSTIIPLIKEVANQTGSPTIDVYSALIDYSNYFPDGLHPNDAGAKIIANTVYRAIISQIPAN